MNLARLLAALSLCVAAQCAAAAPAIPHDSPPVAEAPLDLPALRLRLRETTAIGMFAKLALRSQMDDLLEQFRTYYRSGQTSGVAWLRPPYDSLVLRVILVVQDGDPSLARLVLGSREAIWDILADPKKFESIS